MDHLSRFPESRDELLNYDVLILGDLTAEHLNASQQQAIVDFCGTIWKSCYFSGHHIMH